MHSNHLEGQRILLTHADAFMGPVLAEELRAQGATVIADSTPLHETDAAERVVRTAGTVDTLVANLAIPAPGSRVENVSEDEWRDTFAALRGMKRASTYSAARGAQLGWAQAVGVELARESIRINAIAQNFVDNPTYFPASVQKNPRFQERLKREVPLGRLVSAREDAQFVAYLCSDAANCFVGQVFPVCGGWVQR